jgi:hypothetical protein
MLRRNKKDSQSNPPRIAENTAPGLFSQLIAVLKRIARIFGLAEKPLPIVPQKKADNCPERPAFPAPCIVSSATDVNSVRKTLPLAGSLDEKSELADNSLVVPQQEIDQCAEQPALPERCVVFSDTDNDVNSVRKTLRFAGILDAKGALTDSSQGITIFHTGDLIDKKNPDLSVVEYWQLLQQDALEKGCHVKLIVGNHEQEIWQKIKAGEKYGTGAKQTHWLNDFIESLDLFYVAGPVLFIHGYPTLEFLRTLLHFKEVTGKDLNCFNADHYRKAFRSVNAVKQYAYVRENRQANYLLYDVADASRYYKKQGRVLGAVLEQLKIAIVIHGHRPQRSGVQVDYEFGKWIPKVRMIGNDTMVRRKGIGATVIRMTSSGALDLVFINRKTESNKLRRKVQQKLRPPPVSSRTSRFSKLESADIKSAAQG